MPAAECFSCILPRLSFPPRPKHGGDGRSQTTLGKQLGALDLHSPRVQKKTDAEIKNVILHGQKNMPPFDGQITSAEIDQVISHLREFGKKKK